MAPTEAMTKAVDYFDGTGKTAAALGVSASFVSEMCHGTRSVPPLRALQLERLTNGAVQAVDLCPALREATAA